MAERDKDDEFVPTDDVMSRADEDDETFDEEEEGDFEDEDLADEDETREVGSEGGSPGGSASIRRTRPPARTGSEATETLRRKP